MNNSAMLTNGIAITKKVASTTTPERLTRRSGADITSITRKTVVRGNTTEYWAEVTIASAVIPHGHGYVSGAEVTVTGATQAAYNITATVQVYTRFIFRYRLLADPVVTATGAPDMYADIFVRRLVLWGRTSQTASNTDNLHVGWDSGDGLTLHRVVPDAEVWYEGAQEAKFNIGNLYIDVDTNNEGVVGYYH